MHTVQLGPTNVQVSAIGLGAMHLSLKGRPPEAQAFEVVHRALDAGITFIDTADSYCIDERDKHHNERLLHEALDAYQGDTNGVIVATKGGLMRPEGGGWPRNGDPEHLRQTIRESHRAFGDEHPIDLWQHHAPDPDVPLEESLQPVREAVGEGMIRFVGVSNYSVEEIERAREVVEIVSVQNRYNPWHRAPEKDGVLQYCEDEGLTFLPYSPLGAAGVRKALVPTTSSRHWPRIRASRRSGSCWRGCAFSRRVFFPFPAPRARRALKIRRRHRNYSFRKRRPTA